MIMLERFNSKLITNGLLYFCFLVGRDYKWNYKKNNRFSLHSITNKHRKSFFIMFLLVYFLVNQIKDNNLLAIMLCLRKEKFIIVLHFFLPISEPNTC